MSVSIDKQRFTDKADAVDMIQKAGLHARDGAMAAGDLEDVHWHKTSLKIYVLSGSFETKDVASDTLMYAQAGDLITIPSRTLHAARCPEPATYVVGFESAQAMADFRPELVDDL